MEGHATMLPLQSLHLELPDAEIVAAYNSKDASSALQGYLLLLVASHRIACSSNSNLGGGPATTSE